jgi:hypothetical protein
VYSGIPFHVTVVPRGTNSNTTEKKLKFFFLFIFLIETIKANKTPIFVRENVGALLKSI